MPPMKTQTLTLHQLSSMLYVNRHIFQYVVGARGALSSLQFCPTQSRSHKHSYIASMHTRIHNFRYSNQHKQIAKETGSDVCLHEDTHTNTFKVGYLSCDVCNTVNDRIDSWAPSSFTYFYFSHSISTLNFFLPYKCSCSVRVCVCA